MDTENVGDWHISPLELLHSGPLLDFDLLPGCCSSMTALSLPSLPNVLISDTCGEVYGLCESKLQSLFLQSLQHLKLLQWFHLDCVEITEMPYI
ncbi:hypothetical protein Bca52824_044043 [Brassica carinata]|uniref:Uncharacterized protein n=1 Tax=Brassica carinata TaxID=52824 RepID=A0A8X7V096_BRACI|nr:hypothetical protein Bca52824_044043 [Brassica carinata]